MKDASIDAFVEAAKAWETDEIVRARRSERTAWIVAAVGLGTAVISCVAVALLTPLKSVEPFVVRVDKTTGATDIVTRVDERTVSFNEVLDKYFIGRYVNYREEYSNEMALPNYEAVLLMSEQQTGQAYVKQVHPNNPRSPVKVYGQLGTVEVGVNSIAFLGNDVAQVRFTRTERQPNANVRETNWIATLSYRYLKAAMDEQSRLINPVGFQVFDYRLDPEVVPTGS